MTDTCMLKEVTKAISTDRPHSEGVLSNQTIKSYTHNHMPAFTSSTSVCRQQTVAFISLHSTSHFIQFFVLLIFFCCFTENKCSCSCNLDKSCVIFMNLKLLFVFFKVTFSCCSTKLVSVVMCKNLLTIASLSSSLKF